MKLISFAFILLLSWTYDFHDVPKDESNIIYVNNAVSDTIMHDGKSWQTAFPQLQTALDAAIEGDQIWVATGTYKPVECNPCSEQDRRKSFELKSGVKIYGGFKGWENSLSQRITNTNIIWDNKNATILSGWLNPNDVSYHVVVGDNLTDSSLISGLVVLGGNAEGEEAELQKGGGLLLRNSSLQIELCKFDNNKAHLGGAIYNHFSQPYFLECLFFGTDAGEGAGFYNYFSKPHISDCRFFSTDAEERGGAIYNLDSDVTVESSRFESCKANHGGGAIHTVRGELKLEDCVFFRIRQDSLNVGNLFNKNAKINILRSEWKKGTYTSTESGGAIHNEDCEVYISQSIFSNNRSNQNGGSLYNERTKLRIDSSSWIGNSTLNSGGAIYNLNSKVYISHSTFRNNRADSSGAAVFNDLSELIEINSSILYQNSAINGGAIFNRETTLSLENNTISHNRVDGAEGAGLFCESGEVILQSNTWAFNGGTGQSSIYAGLYSRIQSQNNLFWEKDLKIYSLTSLGYNLFQTEPGEQFTHILKETDLLEEESGFPISIFPGEYGGPTLTHKLTTQSVAKGNGASLDSIEVFFDQRGISRVKGNVSKRLDIGSFQSRSTIIDYSPVPICESEADFLDIERIRLTDITGGEWNTGDNSFTLKLSLTDGAIFRPDYAIDVTNIQLVDQQISSDNRSITLEFLNKFDKKLSQIDLDLAIDYQEAKQYDLFLSGDLMTSETIPLVNVKPELSPQIIMNGDQDISKLFSICVNDEPYEFTAKEAGNPVKGLFILMDSGSQETLQNIEVDSVFTFDPASIQTSSSKNLMLIFQGFTTEDACYKADSITFKVQPVDTIALGIGATLCENVPVVFTDMNSTRIDSTIWNWDFGSVNQPFDTTFYNTTKHRYQESNEYNIRVERENSFGCVASIDTVLTINETPKANFTWNEKRICKGDIVKFDDSTIFSSSPLNWKWKQIDSVTNKVLGDSPSILSKFEKYGNYEIRLKVTSEKGCQDSVTRPLKILPVIKVRKDSAYVEEFDNTRGWFTGGHKSSWEWSMLDTTGLNRPKPPYWVTGVNASYNSLENSYLYSPCYDLSELDRPALAMQLLVNTREDFAGAVLQYLDSRDSLWKILGVRDELSSGKKREYTTGKNWYNELNLDVEPGGQADFAWSKADKEWQDVRHKLDQALDSMKPDFIRFRLAFASSALEEDSLRGIAVDNFRIYNRKRNILVESFLANSEEDTCSQNSKSPVILTNPVQKDAFAINYPFDDIEVKGRRLFYGISLCDRLVSSGIDYFNRNQFDSLGMDNEFNTFEQIINLKSLEDPLFEIEYDPFKNEIVIKNISGEKKTDIRVQALAFSSESGIKTSLKFLPNASGVYHDKLENDISIDLCELLKDAAWDYGTDPLALLVFVQNDVSKEVYQLEVIEEIMPECPVLRRGMEATDFLIYPNPASDKIMLENTLGKEAKVIIYDLLGKTLREEALPKELRHYTIDIQNLSEGTYILQISTKDKVDFQGRLIVIR